MEIQGRIKFISQSEFLGANSFQKRDLVITTEEQYPQDIIIQFTQGKCALLDNLQLGQKVNVHFNLRGREWTSPQGEIKYFNTLEGWKVEIVQVTNVANQQGGYQQPVQQQQGYQNPSNQVPQQQGSNQQNSYQQPVGAKSAKAEYVSNTPNNSQQPPVYQNPQQPTQTQMFDNNGQAPVNQQEDELELPF